MATDLTTLDTDRLPVEERLQALQDAFACALMRCRFRPLTDEKFRAEFQWVALSDVRVAALTGTPLFAQPLPPENDAREHSIYLNIVVSGELSMRQGGRTYRASDGEGLICHDERPFLGVAPVPFKLRAVKIPQSALGAMSVDIERLLFMVLPAHLPEMLLLSNYLGGVVGAGPLDDDALSETVGAQVTDLTLSALARMLRLDDPTEGRGIRAARLEEVKRIVDEQLSLPTLNVVRVARQIGVTERYVQKLLEEIGTTFSAYVMEKRLAKAYRLLAWERAGGLAIREVAWASGFSDASHFTRAFRRRYSETPSAVRGMAGNQPPHS